MLAGGFGTEVSWYLQDVPVRDIPRARTSMGTVRVHLRRSMLRSGWKSSGCFSSRVCIRDMMDMSMVLPGSYKTSLTLSGAGIRLYRTYTATSCSLSPPPTSNSAISHTPTRTSLDTNPAAILHLATQSSFHEIRRAISLFSGYPCLRTIAGRAIGGCGSRGSRFPQRHPSVRSWGLPLFISGDVQFCFIGPWGFLSLKISGVG